MEPIAHDARKNQMVESAARVATGSRLNDMAWARVTKAARWTAT
jgi:hypothetical protein